MYVEGGYSVVDTTTGDWKLEGRTREQCERMIRTYGNSRWVIMKRRVLVPKKRKVVEMVYPEPLKKTKTLVVAKHRDGTIHKFDTRREAGDFFGVTGGNISGRIDRGGYCIKGATKDWYFYTKRVEV